MKVALVVVGALAVAGRGDTVIPLSPPTYVAAVAVAGNHVVWTDGGRVFRERAEIWRMPPLAVPPAVVTAHPEDNVTPRQSVEAFDASGSRLVWVRFGFAWLAKKCRPRCLPVEYGVPLLGELWTARAGGPPSRVAGGPGRPIVREAAVAGDAVLYTDEDVDSGVRTLVLLTPGVSKRVLYSGKARRFRYLARAGRYAAWVDEHVNRFGDSVSASRVVVYDVVRRREAYALSAKALHTDGLWDLDVTAEGRLFWVGDRMPRGGCSGGAAWASLREPRPHFLPLATLGNIAAAGTRFVVMTGRTCGVEQLALRLQLGDRSGRVRTIFGPTGTSGAFAFDGRRIAFADVEGSRIVVKSVPR